MFKNEDHVNNFNLTVFPRQGEGPPQGYPLTQGHTEYSQKKIRGIMKLNEQQVTISKC